MQRALDNRSALHVARWPIVDVFLVVLPNFDLRIHVEDHGMSRTRKVPCAQGVLPVIGAADDAAIVSTDGYLLAVRVHGFFNRAERVRILSRRLRVSDAHSSIRKTRTRLQKSSVAPLAFMLRLLLRTLTAATTPRLTFAGMSSLTSSTVPLASSSIGTPSCT